MRSPWDPGAHLTLFADGHYTYDPNRPLRYAAGGQSTTDSFQLQPSPNSKGVSDIGTVVITVNGVNDDPVITSAATATPDENQTSVLTVYGHGSGRSAHAGIHASAAAADENFSSASTPAPEVLSFKNAPDFETPTDANADGKYLVTVQVDDGKGGIDTQDITITVKTSSARLSAAPAVLTQTVREHRRRFALRPRRQRHAHRGRGQR